ncbi:DUF5107 domain-containing protein [Lapidilactobacillus wuchangensis]|uniref:DUF5107 domain-containing protein n=1 Tax=Lapidilactobacillus wuchangensis TaxID=2486001 RepID=UPI000F774092|nr:DUF5107 domain-containing protein [Lapidilactobacillus wuchangensis]
MDSVKVYHQKQVIPTYQPAAPDKNPMFFEQRVYQGSSGRVYPLPVTEKIADHPVDQTYDAIILENQYLQITILPELGGRIQRALDKTNNYDFVYYNHVIKPALVGLVGPWISGGIEFNWPQHHRPTTFMPTQATTQENADGSKTVLISDIDQMYGTKSLAKFTLYPDKAYLEIKGQLYNRTSTPQTFLWWANPAVAVNDHTESIFPPDVHAVMDHGKRAVSAFPIATGEYYKYDYSRGVDISKYKNVKVPTSYMANHSNYDFMGNYDEQQQAGLLHIADHHVSPGKKQWTWGNAEFGQAWYRNLTDHDGPYIELMTGVYTDNQPDFTWLKPYEEKTFTQYFMPYKAVGRIKNATLNAVINLEPQAKSTKVTVYAPQIIKEAKLELSHAGQVLATQEFSLAAAAVKTFDLPITLPVIDETVTVRVIDQVSGRVLVSYTGQKQEIHELPEPAKKILAPVDIKTNEELWLAAQHIEQYRNVALNATDYYLEGLRRDPDDSRLNISYGMQLYRQGEFAAATQHFQTAIKRITERTPNPYYGEAYFDLGLALLQQNQLAPAYDAFYKATWSAETKSGAFYYLGVIAFSQQNYGAAQDFLKQSLISNYHNLNTRLLLIHVQELLHEDPAALIKSSLQIDPLNLGLNFEAAQSNTDCDFAGFMQGRVKNYLALAETYLNARDDQRALAVLATAPENNPLVHYYRAFALQRLGKTEQLQAEITAGNQANPDYCFPNKLIEQRILEAVIAADTAQSGWPHYYLGNLLFDKKRYPAAIEHWQVAAEKLPDFAIVRRNLAAAAFNIEHDVTKAIALQEQACQLNPTDPRLLLERDVLAQDQAEAPEKRLARLEAHQSLLTARDDLLERYLQLLNGAQKFNQAADILQSHHFHAWEGGEGKVSAQYEYTLIEQAKQALNQQRPELAVKLLEHAKERPINLSEGKLPSTNENIADYYLAQAYQALGEKNLAKQALQAAAVGLDEPGSVLYYYDQPADTMLYQGMAAAELGEYEHAQRCFHQLITFGQKHYYDQPQADYFAVSLPETSIFHGNLQRDNRIYCNYLLGLGYLGLQNLPQAEVYLQRVLAAAPDHLGALRHLRLLQK